MFCRDMSLNAHYIVALINARDRKHFMYLASEMYREGSLGLYNAYLDETQEFLRLLSLGCDPKYERRSEVTYKHNPV